MMADAPIQARIDQLNAQLAQIMGTVIGSSTVFIPRADACGNGVGRTCEPLVDNVTTDAMRATYGTDFAIINSGGLRADLTCPRRITRAISARPTRLPHTLSRADRCWASCISGT